jgi:solute carrier family 35 protein
MLFHKNNNLIKTFSNDLAFDLLGYVLIMINNLSSSANGVYMKQKLDAKDLGQYGLMFYNSLMMFPIMLLVAAYTGDLALVCWE